MGDTKLEPPSSFDVYLNVYNFMKYNRVLGCLGMDIYHTGVEIGDIEYSYFLTHTDPEFTGIMSLEPETCAFEFIEKIYMGEARINLAQLEESLLQFQRRYTCGNYHIFQNNCNHFSDELTRELVGKGIPKRIFRPTNVLRLVCCCLPKEFLSGQWSLRKYKEAVEKEKEAFPTFILQ